MRDVPYCKAIGSLMYTTLGTHPDIMFAVLFLSQFMQNPGRPHWEAIKRVFHYLKGTCEHTLTIGKHGTLSWNNKTCTSLQGYCNVDWASQGHQHLMSGYIFMIDGGAVSWSSKKQTVVMLSTTEAE